MFMPARLNPEWTRSRVAYILTSARSKSHIIADSKKRHREAYAWYLKRVIQNRLAMIVTEIEESMICQIDWCGPC